MKKIMLMAVAILFSAATVFAVNINPVPDTIKIKKVKPVAKVQYTCPMHHDVLTDKPGKCPKPNCGMTLVKVDPTKKKTAMKM